MNFFVWLRHIFKGAISATFLINVNKLPSFNPKLKSTFHKNPSHVAHKKMCFVKKANPVVVLYVGVEHAHT